MQMDLAMEGAEEASEAANEASEARGGRNSCCCSVTCGRDEAHYRSQVVLAAVEGVPGPGGPDKPQAPEEIRETVTHAHASWSDVFLVLFNT